MLAIIDYKVVNLGSMANMLKRVGNVEFKIAERPADVKGASHLILPGVGSFRAGSAQLKSSGFASAIQNHVAEGGSLLGVCLGMQLLGDESEEGEGDGLSLIPGKILKLKREGMRIPHMGWNEVTVKKSSFLIDNLPEHARFYFVHSYHFVPTNAADVVLETNYGGPLVAGISYGKVHGFQFHPEKSHRFGMEILRNYAREATCSRA